MSLSVTDPSSLPTLMMLALCVEVLRMTKEVSSDRGRQWLCLGVQGSLGEIDSLQSWNESLSESSDTKNVDFVGLLHEIFFVGFVRLWDCRELRQRR